MLLGMIIGLLLAAVVVYVSNLGSSVPQAIARTLALVMFMASGGALLGHLV